MKFKLKILLSLLLVVMVLTACNDWLDVTSKTEIPSETHFNSESGFKDAVIGVYVKMASDKMYGKTLTWHVNEFVSQNYAEVAGAPDLNVPKYEYMQSPFVGYRNNIWGNCYKVIANINNILRYEEKNRNIMSPILDSLVRGELLGLRAMLHFDLLRMFGKGNLEGRPELMAEMSLPYSLDFNKYAPEQVSYERFFEYLKKDIEEAIAYLYVDPMTFREKKEYYESNIDNTFLKADFYERRFRMNYYAAQGLYARILMWEGTPEAKKKALTIAESLIESQCYGWATSANVLIKNQQWWNSDLLFKNEHLFTIAVEKFAEYQECMNGTRNWFDASSPNTTYSVVYLNKTTAGEIYEAPGTGDNDWRYTECLLPQGNGALNYGLVKLRQHPEHSPNYSNMIPLIRISEMYYIAAECRLEPGENYDRDMALEYLSTVRDHRGITQDLPTTLTDEEIGKEIYKEYRKEFVGEGQIFFYYKRKGMERIPGYNGIMTDQQYQYPMPDDEIILGGRVE